MLMTYVIQTNDLHKSYGKVKVLNGLTMHVPKGSIYGFVGKNGAGKTTLIRLVCGLQYQTSGSLEICGIKNTDKKINETRKKMGAIVETPALHLNMTAKENLKIQLDVLGVKDDSQIDSLLEFVGLSDTWKKQAKNFSLGMRQRLAIAVALCSEPEILVLDEPINGLDPQGIIEMRELLVKINKERGITILISSHILDELSKVATHYGFISNGKIVAEMSAEEMEASGQRTITLLVNNTNNIERALSKFNNKYKVIDAETIVVYGNVVMTELVLALYEEQIVVNRVIDKEESLEERFFELLGGDTNA
jgi:ABC-2 type transport system ATP-binding protein